MPDLTQATKLLDYTSPSLSTLIAENGWHELPLYERIGAVYDFLRDEIKFGYNIDDAIPASQVLRDGFGQCNTKATLLMALLRGVGVPSRLHGFTIHKNLQRGVVPPIAFPIAPESIIHSWVEIEFESQWINLEGFILDKAYLGKLQASFADTDKLCGYGAGTRSLQSPGVGWNGKSTYIQNTSINQDFGLFDTPDEFYAKHRQAFGPLKGWLYRNLIRYWMNARVQKIRGGHRPARLSTFTYEAKTKAARI